MGPFLAVPHPEGGYTIQDTSGDCAAAFVEPGCTGGWYQTQTLAERRPVALNQEWEDERATP